MKGALKLFTLFGISVYIHATFLILPAIFFIYAGLKGLFVILIVFAFVTLHELSHSLVAKRYGIIVRSIMLFPIGGVASLTGSTQKPKEEIYIAIAGPIFNVLLTVIFFFPLLYLLGPKVLLHPSLDTWPQTIAYIFWINPLLAMFNLLPAFPMDGGRIFRALLATHLDIRKATHIAVNVGHMFALIFGIIGIINGNLFLIAIAFFVYIAASAEELQVDMSETIKDFLVKDVISDNYISVTPQTRLAKVLEFMFRTHQEDFPVLDGENLVGFLPRSDIISHIHRFGISHSIKELMRYSFPTAQLYEPLNIVQKRMQEEGLKALPVIYSGRLVGIITLEDISRVYAIMSEQHRVR